MKRIDYILDFCKELGKQMIVSGANIERVDHCIERVCHAYGLHDVTCANLSTRISISAKDENKEYAHRQTDVPPQAINLERLKKLNNLSFEVVREKPPVETLYDLLHAVQTNDFPWWFILLGFVVAMAGLARIFCAGWQEILIVELNTLLLFGLSKAFSKVHINKIITNFISMFLCTLIAMGFHALGFVNFYIVCITNAFFLIPGIPMINCARNLLCGNEMNGAIDLLKVLLEVCSIVAGIAAAYAILGGVVGQPLIEDTFDLRSGLDPLLSSFELIVLTLMASAGFSITFNIQLKDLPFAALGGVIVRVVYILFQLCIPYRFVYTMLAAFFAALYSEILAMVKKEPSTLNLYPAVVPLIPGDLFYYVALGLIWGKADFITQFGPDLVLTLVGISVGFVVCSTIVHYVRKFRFLRIKQ